MEENYVIEFATYRGTDFKHGLRCGEDYRIKFNSFGGSYKIFAKSASMDSDILIVYNRLSEIINDWSFIQ